jgi:hypothetical protein
MALPKLDSPVYELELPLSKKKIRFRPFLVKEQKNLLMAMESNDKDNIEQNIKQVLNNCTLTTEVDIEKLPVIDVEYYFLQLRARSVGEVVENKYRCDNEVTTEDNSTKVCGNLMETQLNLLDIKIEHFEEGKDIVELTDKLSVKLKYPEFSVLKRISNLENPADIAFEMIADSIEYIYDGDQFYYAHESSPKELIEFVESLNQKQFSKIEDFFTNLPKIQKTIEMKCSRCGFEHKLEVEGLESFFG